MKYQSEGYLVTVVSENDLPHGLYAADGSTRVTEDPGQGLYAPNGSIRIGDSGNSIYTPDGAWNGTLVVDVFYPRGYDG